MDHSNSEKQERNFSYVQARDPSILACDRPGLEIVRKNLGAELMDDVSAEKKQTTDTHMQVYLRIKSGIPFQNLYVIESNTLKCKIPQEPHASVMKNYSFSKIFDPETTQIDVFNYVVKSKMLDFINGCNSTLLTYGASGSGKSFTIVGTEKELGVIPRALEYLFRTLPQLSERPSVKALPSGDVIRLDKSACREEINVCNNLLQASTTLLNGTHHIRTYKAMQQRLSNEPAAILNGVSNVSLGIWVSFVEIYNEHIYDLLQPKPSTGKHRHKLHLTNSGLSTHVKNLKTVSVTSGIDAYKILQYGIHNLKYAATLVNSHSNRSHYVFTLRLAQASEEGTCVSHFNFCDLAGSQRLKKSMSVGETMKEANYINNTLLVLRRCIYAVRNSQKQSDNELVPFRESKLTQLFQKALSGFENIAMIVNMNPSQEMLDENHHVLNFSAIAKDSIAEQPQIIEPRKNNRFLIYMQNKKKESLHPIAKDAQENESDNAFSRLVTKQEQEKLEIRAIYEMKLREVEYWYETQLKKNTKRIRRDDNTDEDDRFTGQEPKLEPIETSNLDDTTLEKGDCSTVQIWDHKKAITLEQQTELQQKLAESLLSIRDTELTFQDAQDAYKEMEDIAKWRDDKNKELSHIINDLMEKNRDLEDQISQERTLKINALVKAEKYRKRYYAKIEKGNTNAENRRSYSDSSMSSRESSVSLKTMKIALSQT